MFSKPSTSAKGHVTAEQKYVTFTIYDKLDIITCLKKGINSNSIMSEFNIGL